MKNVSVLIGQLLIEEELVSAEDLDKALHLSSISGGRVGAALVRIGAISEENLLSMLARQLELTILKLDDIPDAQSLHQTIVKSRINLDWFLAREALIWESAAMQVSCIATDPVNHEIREVLIRNFPDTQLIFYLVSNYTFEQISSQVLLEANVDSIVRSSDDTIYLREIAEEAPVIDLVNNLLSQAVDSDASDIHIEPEDTYYKVRFRIDGVLVDRLQQSIERFPAVVSRIKLISGLDIAERRLPQDGRITTRVAGLDMDLRVSTLPGVFGESVVLRLLPKNRESLTLGHLGLESDHLHLLENWSKSAGGIVLVTGPTGSGKSTTLHGAISATNDGIRKIVTVEDPVEIQVVGITQIQVNAEIGFTFSRALRSILRQDPDVIMIGEIRDLETAEIAIQSALSGHLVLSTLHTNDAISSFTRLIDMGLEPFLVAAPMKGVQAQRLVRRLCPHCSEPAVPDPKILNDILEMGVSGIGKNWRSPVGCDSCQGTGYRGRLGVYQMVPVDEKLKEMIVRGATLFEMQNHAAEMKYRNLYQDGLLKASKGETSVEELLRVLVTEDIV
ncbi:MAG: type II secretion system protein [Blastopirellula sp.]|nr:type II secretion system protein [Blastopirellula sp.]